MIRLICQKFAAIPLVFAVILMASFLLPGTAQASRLSPVVPHNSHNSSNTPILPLASFNLRGIDGPYHTQGNLILGSDNYPYLFHGMARDDLEYFCKGDGHYSASELAYMGVGNNSTNKTYWGANVVRLPLSENFWLFGQPSVNCSANQYRALIQQTVQNLTNMNLNVILDLAWTNAD